MSAPHTLAALGTSPLAYWPLTSSADLTDATGNGHTLTATGTVSDGTLSNGMTGVDVGGSDYLSAADATALRPDGFTSDGWTVSAWLERDASPGTQMGYFGKMRTAGVPDKGIAVGLWTDYSYNHLHGSGAGSANNTANPYNRDQTNSDQLPVNTATHVVWVYDYSGKLSKCYIDGTLAGTVTEYGTNRDTWTWGSTDPNDAALTIGLGNSALGGFQGKLTGVGYWDRPLDASEIATLYAGVPVPVGTVTLDGTDVSHRVFGQLTIHHGRTNVSDQPEAATCTVLLYRDTPISPAAGQTLTVSLNVDNGTTTQTKTRFIGHVTDLDSPLQSSAQVVRITAVSNALGRIARHIVGASPFSQEKDGTRIYNILNAADSTLAAAADLDTPGQVTILARDIDRQRALGLCQDVAQQSFGVLSETPTGQIVYQDSEARRTPGTPVTIDASTIANVAGAFQRTGTLINRATVGWGTSEPQSVETAYDSTSETNWGTFEAYLATQLALQADAAAIADRAVSVWREPRWQTDQLPVIMRHGNYRNPDAHALADLRVGSYVELTGLVWPMPATILGFVEGWRETISAVSKGSKAVTHTLELYVSESALTAPAQRWIDVGTGHAWSDTATGLTWIDAYTEVVDP